MNEATIKIRVTRKDIKLGERAKCTSCPLARALNRMTKHVWYVNSNVALTMPEGGYVKRLKLTDQMKDFIRLFDRGRGVNPTTFILPVSAISTYNKIWR